MSENIWWGMNEKLKKYNTQKNIEETAKQAEKQTKILKEAEDRKIQAMYDIAKQEEKRRIEEKAQEQEEYNHRRNQRIFDEIGFNYEDVENVIICNNYIRERVQRLESKQDEKMSTEEFEIEDDKDYVFCEQFDKEFKGNNIYKAYIDREEKIGEFKENIEILNKKLNTFIIIAIIVDVLLCIVNLIIGGIAIILSIIVGIFIKQNKQKVESNYENLCKDTKIVNEYTELFDNFKKNKIEKVKKQYELVMNNFENFRKQHYNKEIETALNLVGVSSNTVLNGDLGTKEDYKIYFKDLWNELMVVKNEVEKIPLINTYYL